MLDGLGHGSPFMCWATSRPLHEIVMTPSGVTVHRKLCILPRRPAHVLQAPPGRLVILTGTLVLWDGEVDMPPFAGWRQIGSEGDVARVRAILCGTVVVIVKQDAPSMLGLFDRDEVIMLFDRDGAVVTL